MQRVILDLQNYVMSDAIKMALVKNGDIQVETAKGPKETVKKCFNFAATVVIMEVTGYTPWKLSERLKIRDELKKTCPNCKIVLLVDENADEKVTEQVKQTKVDCIIDQFIYGSISSTYLAALIETI